MGHSRGVAALALVLGGVLLTGCSSEAPKEMASGSGDSRSSLTPPALDPYEPDVGSLQFVDGIDNRFMPLQPGTRYVYEGRSDGELERVVISVLQKTKTVMGIDCTVVKDVVRVDGEIAEKTFDWFAQDTSGNVWYLGENSHEYANGKPINAHGSWEAGVDGALPGIVMLADPQVGQRYRQEYLVGKAEDLAEVFDIDGSASTPYREFSSGLLVTKDWNPLEPNTDELKYYAPGIGLVFEEALFGSRSTLGLVDMRTTG
jgi:hypothetical protein